MESAPNPALVDLTKLVHEQRRKLAGQIRITREEKDLREQMASVLDKAGVARTTVRVDSLDKTFDVFVVDRDGRRYAVVNPIPEPSNQESSTT